jgi:hypothetical protein
MLLDNHAGDQKRGPQPLLPHSSVLQAQWAQWEWHGVAVCVLSTVSRAGDPWMPGLQPSQTSGAELRLAELIYFPSMAGWK